MKTKQLISAVCGTIFKVVFTIVVAMAIYKGAMLAYDYGYRVFMEPPLAAGEGRMVTVAVTENMSPTEMGNMLASKGLVRDSRLFAIQYLLSEYREDVAPGVYDLSTSMTAEEMLAVMAKPAGETEDKKEDGNSAPGSGASGGEGDENSGDGESAGEDQGETEEGGE